MTRELAEHITILAAPIYAAFIAKASVPLIETEEWQQDARAAALRQARLLWDEALEAEP